MDIYTGENFSLIEEKEKVYIKVSKSNQNLKEISTILNEFPRIKVDNFLNLRNAVRNADNDLIVIGQFLPEIDVYITSDEMECRIQLNLSQDYINNSSREIVSMIIKALEENDVKEGIVKEAFGRNFPSGEFITVAKGSAAIRGEDAKVRYYEFSEKKPVINSQGKANFYELNLIDQVEKGEWLGEKILPTNGVDGKTVTGKKIPAQKGKDQPLRYDPKSVEITKEGNRKVLRAKKNGAVKKINGRIKVEDHLIIPDDVDFSTGNIDFDGHITVEGTVKDGFSVTATKDISINGDIGLGAVDKIESYEGSVYIKGGINGKSRAVITAGKDVYIKFCNETSIRAGGTIDIGLYSIDCNLEANKIVFDQYKGRMIGGEIDAKTQIIAGTIGNKYEKKTEVRVQGFNRIAIKDALVQLLEEYKSLLSYAEKIKMELDIYSFKYQMKRSDELDPEFDHLVRQYDQTMDKVNQLNDKRLELQSILKSRGEGEVSIYQAAFPQTFLRIKAIKQKIDKLVKGTFYVKDNNLHYE